MKHAPTCALLLLLLAATACRDAPPDASPFPAALAASLLDQPLPAAIARLEDAWPDAHTTQQPFVRTTLPKHPWLEEVVLFQDLRAARVNTVILKCRADLDDAKQQQALTAAGGPALEDFLSKNEALREIPYRPGVVLRARRRDKQGRLTLTLDAARQPPGGDATLSP